MPHWPQLCSSPGQEQAQPQGAGNEIQQRRLTLKPAWQSQNKGYKIHTAMLAYRPTNKYELSASAFARKEAPWCQYYTGFTVALRHEALQKQCEISVYKPTRTVNSGLCLCLKVPSGMIDE